MSKDTKDTKGNSPIEKNIKKSQKELDNLKKGSVDAQAINSLINEAVHIVSKSLRSTKIPAKEKRDRALSIVNKAMSGSLNIKHEVGTSFLDLIKQANKTAKEKVNKKK